MAIQMIAKVTSFFLYILFISLSFLKQKTGHSRFDL